MLAIIGGDPARFVSLRRAVRKGAQGVRFRTAADRRARARSCRRDRRTSARATVAAFPRAANQDRRRTRLVAAYRAQFDREAGPQERSSLAPRTRSLGRSPRHRCTLSLSRFDLKYSNGPMPHEQMLRSIELIGTRVHRGSRSCSPRHQQRGRRSPINDRRAWVRWARAGPNGCDLEKAGPGSAAGAARSRLLQRRRPLRVR